MLIKVLKMIMNNNKIIDGITKIEEKTDEIFNDLVKIIKDYDEGLRIISSEIDKLLKMYSEYRNDEKSENLINNIDKILDLYKEYSNFYPKLNELLKNINYLSNQLTNMKLMNWNNKSE